MIPSDRLRDLVSQQREAIAGRPGRSVGVHELHIENERDQYLIDVLAWNREYDAKADARRDVWLATPEAMSYMVLFGIKM